MDTPAYGSTTGSGSAATSSPWKGILGAFFSEACRKAGVLGGGGAGVVAVGVAVAAVDDAGRTALGSEVDLLFDLPGRGDADVLGGHLVVRLAVDRLAAGGRCAEVDGRGLVSQLAPRGVR